MNDPLADLVSRAQSGDRAALGHLISQTHGQVYNLAYRILGNAQEAEDLTQEIFVRMWRGLPRFRGHSKFTTWLHAITTNTCLNRRRKLRQKLENEIDHEEFFEQFSSSFGNPAQETVRQDQREGLWKAIEELPQKYSLILALFYQQQLSYKEIAEVLSVPLGTVKGHLSRARRALAASLKRMEMV